MSNTYQLTEQYFKCFKEKNIKGLRDLYDVNVTLKDWETELSGVENMIKANTSLFLLNYELTVNSIEESGNITRNHITIDFGSESINVIDIIEFKDNKIVSVNAYKE